VLILSRPLPSSLVPPLTVVSSLNSEKMDLSQINLRRGRFVVNELEFSHGGASIVVGKVRVGGTLSMLHTVSGS
jgi:hypothetical protein